MSECLKCGGTGIDVLGNICDCTKEKEISIPYVANIPAVYQSCEFSQQLVPMRLNRKYGIELEDIINFISKKGRYNSNLLICSPPNTGKTIFAYSILRHLYLKGVQVPDLLDLIEVKELIMSTSYDEDVINKKNKIITSPILIVKIPLDIPIKFAETMSTILERRVRKNGNTIFLYGNTVQNLKNQDKYGVLNNIIKDGSYNSIRVIDYQYNDFKEGLSNET